MSAADRLAQATATRDHLRDELAAAEAEVLSAADAAKQEALAAHLEWARRTVATWPAWKREALGVRT